MIIRFVTINYRSNFQQVIKIMSAASSSSPSVGSNMLSSFILAPILLIFSAVSLSTLQKGLDKIGRIAKTKKELRLQQIFYYISHKMLTKFLFTALIYTFCNLSLNTSTPLSSESLKVKVFNK